MESRGKITSFDIRSTLSMREKTFQQFRIFHNPSFVDFSTDGKSEKCMLNHRDSLSVTIYELAVVQQLSIKLLQRDFYQTRLYQEIS